MLLQDGVLRIGNFIHSEKYNIESAIVNASKAAYLSKLIEYGIDEVKHYDKSMFESISSETLQLPINTKLNKLKKTLGEAFFYWLEIQEIVKERQKYCLFLQSDLIKVKFLYLYNRFCLEKKLSENLEIE